MRTIFTCCQRRHLATFSSWTLQCPRMVLLNFSLAWSLWTRTAKMYLITVMLAWLLEVKPLLATTSMITTNLTSLKKTSVFATLALRLRRFLKLKLCLRITMHIHHVLPVLRILIPLWSSTSLTPLYASAEDIFDDIHASEGLDCFSTVPIYGSPPAFSEDPILRAAYIQAFVAASVHGATHDMVQYMLQGSFETISSMSRRIPY
ncbi:hypothetical protein A0H81_04645, partial [Grifola frondosa]